MKGLLRRFWSALRRRRLAAAKAEADSLPCTGPAVEAGRRRHLARMQDETIARVMFGQG